MEAGPPVLTKRLWHIVRVLFFMLRKGISKSKLMVDLHLMMKRGKIAGKKAIGNLMFHHHSNFSCRSSNAHASSSFFAPREYEFSCSNSPAFPFHLSKRKSHHHSFQNHHNHHYFSCIHPTPIEDDITVLHKALEILNSDISAGVSPAPFLPGFGKSPMVRQLRVTDSPFPIKDPADVDSRVDKEAEEFIERFYEQLRMQKKKAAMDARYHEMMMAGY
ncbi:uncharacterized protein LOC131249334 [Magnolia sinica]|uniref:uncharacterized protein LOC131249334 n=1 Tax=Magnolia sinica TaxID=86752 RepID=UPI00265AE75C|nr:uncharacterized protein LOC131249334 [Magnolia sinica]